MTPDAHTVQRVLDVFAGRAGMAGLDRDMCDDVVIHMDRYSSTGTASWSRFMRYVHAAGGLEDLSLTVEDAEALPGDRLRVTIGGRGMRGGRPVAAAPASVIYRFEDGRIAEIWTTRKNYAFFFGDAICSRLGFARLTAQIAIWCARQDLIERLGRRSTTAC